MGRPLVIFDHMSTIFEPRPNFPRVCLMPYLVPESTIPKSCQEMVHIFARRAIEKQDTTFQLFIVFTALMHCEPIRMRYLPDDVSEPLFTWMTETLQEAWENLFMGCDPKTRIPSLVDFVSHLQTEASVFMHAPSTRSDY